MKTSSILHKREFVVKTRESQCIGLLLIWTGSTRVQWYIEGGEAVKTVNPAVCRENSVRCPVYAIHPLPVNPARPSTSAKTTSSDTSTNASPDSSTDASSPLGHLLDVYLIHHDHPEMWHRQLRVQFLAPWCAFQVGRRWLHPWWGSSPYHFPRRLPRPTRDRKSASLADNGAGSSSSMWIMSSSWWTPSVPYLSLNRARTRMNMTYVIYNDTISFNKEYLTKL